VLIFVLAFSVVVFGFYEEPMRRAIRARLTHRAKPVEPVAEPIYAERSVDTP
jgi:peptidoglycan/LPS O-acetylase OafA/YrhL